ncbi:Protein of unknown function [Arachidicoccus rhizosphaerae]|uniref:DUF4197 domain-containing protein n=1 Tax=Arachidicoccus rhizosphaerae TaxID=551991 RepID=A0A1H4CIM1_9BACT|nr:DUF4197 domain-containing protein [Arachidicoccus rhizosphaerae]SEA60189.1 Protein of unknown function [Arachidicoccus rhizosphaerae]
MKKTIMVLSLAIGMTAMSCGDINQISSSLPGVSAVTGNTQNTAIKDLLTNAVVAGIGNLGTSGGFLNNSLYKILLPPEAQQVASTLTTLGLGSVVNKAVTQINTSAEGAVGLAKPIFVSAIKSMSITDAANLITGGDNAITNYFKTKTTSQLMEAFTPVIKNSLDKNDATKYYTQIADTYNKVPLVKNKLNPDLTNYVATKAVDAMFNQMQTAEKDIRHDPAKQTTAALKAIFGSK